MKKKYLFITHIGVGNRGCEALTKSICILLGLQREQTEIYSKYYEEDQNSDIQEYGKVYKANYWSELSIYKKIIYKIQELLTKNTENIQRMKCRVGNILPSSIVFMTGGDLYCYKSTIRQMLYLHRYSHKYKATSMLIGCSIEEKYLTNDVITDLKGYSLITVRESITYNSLKKAGIKENVFLVPDSAFILEPQEDGVSGLWSKEFVGINVSPFVCDKRNKLFDKNINSLIQYILEETDYDIVFFPHVFWKEQDDRKVIKEITKRFKSSRISTFKSEKMNYCQIRYAISKSKFFIGARTHSVISAYSMCVPTIALGYSVKSVGIAKDLGLDDKLVLDCKKLYNEEQLKDTFRFLQDNEVKIKNDLCIKIPQYIESAKKLKGIVEKYY